MAHRVGEVHLPDQEEGRQRVPGVLGRQAHAREEEEVSEKDLSPDEQLAEDLAGFYADPLGYVMYAFPWDEEPSIQLVELKSPYKERFPGATCKVSTCPFHEKVGEHAHGPDVWACEFLDQLGEEIRKRAFDGSHAVAPIQFSTVSGHGIGKSTMSGWLAKFILDTRPMSVGTVTAMTAEQLKNKTWAAVGRWHKMSLTSHWFDYTSGRGAMALKSNRLNRLGESLALDWNCTALTCREENSEAFAGQHAANATSFYIFDEACFRAETEVLTDRGWLYFSSLTPQHRLLTPEGWQQPTALHAFRRRGVMLRIRKRGLSVTVTPNHEMYGLTRAGIAKKVRAEQVTELMAPRTVEWSAPEYVVSDDELRLAAWYYSEGHLVRNIYEYKNNGRGRPRTVGKWHGFGITNNKDNGISELLDRLELRWSKHRNQWLVYEPERAIAFSKQGVGCLEKTLPEWMLQLSRRQLRLFLKIYALGDGYARGKKRIIYTSSQRMANALHAMAVLAGYNSSLTRRRIAGQRKWIKDHWATSTRDGWVVTLSETGAGVKLTRGLFEEVDYNGMVYCATVPAGLLLTRDEGTVIWSGNSGVPNKIFEVREGGLTDGEPMTFDWGNGTRNSGRFFEQCQGRFSKYQIVRSID
ncbi:hypothetical protein LCGC14_1838790, partial [marine sediment metagenome]